MKRFKLMFKVLGFLFICCLSNSFAQVADSSQAPAFNQNDIVEAGEAVIQIQVEKPQVQLFSQRIKPEFDEVNLEKSFLKEILDEGQGITIETSKTQATKQIDIKKLLKKNR